MNKTYTVTLEQDANGDLVLPIPQPILDQMHWHEGTVLNFAVNSDNTITLTEVSPETYAPSIDDMLRSLLGSQELVEAWWNSPNQHFDYLTPKEANRESVYEYVLSHSSYPG
jgi:antitoxin component of MazEF toxin-antitoxin module